MRARTAKLIFAGAAVVAVPVSFVGGLALKEYFLSNELEGKTDTTVPHERAMRARIVQLAQERNSLMNEGKEIDAKIVEMRGKMESGT